MEIQKYFIKQNNHQEIMLKTLHHLFTKEALMDATLSCEGKTLKAHKIILSASSPLFENLIQENSSHHPIFIFQETKYSDLKSIIDFIYKGEIFIPYGQLLTFLKTAKALKIRGLSEDEINDTIASQVTSKSRTEESFPERVENSYKKEHKNEDFNNNECPAKHIESETAPLIKKSLPLTNSSCGPFPTYSNKDEFINNSMTKREIKSTEEYPSDCETVKNFEINKKEEKFDLINSPVNPVSSKICKVSPKRERLDDSVCITSKALKPSLSLKNPTDSIEISDPESTMTVETTNETAAHNFAFSSSLKRFENLPDIKPTLNNEKAIHSTVCNIKYCDDVMSNNSTLSLQETNHLSNNYLRNIVKQENKSDNSRTNSDVFRCEICQKIFAEESTLNIHRRFHIEEKPFSCYICQKKFSWESKLKEHLKIHSEINRFVCYICKQRFNERGNLNKHMRFHIGEKPFPCSLCSKRFSRKIELKRHIETHTKDEYHISEEKISHKKDLNSNTKKHAAEIIVL